MAKTKKQFAERVLVKLSSDPLTRDNKYDEREVYLVMDGIVNALARDRHLKNWEMGNGELSEMFMTTWGLNNDPITVVDPGENIASYFIFPVNYTDLPRNVGIQIIPMLNAEVTVIIQTIRESRLYRNTPAGGLQGRLGGYPVGDRFVFNQAKVRENYGDMMLRLPVRDSSVISDTAIYPMAADIEDIVIETTFAKFADRLARGSDVVRDNNNRQS